MADNKKKSMTSAGSIFAAILLIAVAFMIRYARHNIDPEESLTPPEEPPVTTAVSDEMNGETQCSIEGYRLSYDKDYNQVLVVEYRFFNGTDSPQAFSLNFKPLAQQKDDYGNTKEFTGSVSDVGLPSDYTSRSELESGEAVTVTYTFPISDTGSDTDKLDATKPLCLVVDRTAWSVGEEKRVVYEELEALKG